MGEIRPMWDVRFYQRCGTCDSDVRFYQVVVRWWSLTFFVEAVRTEKGFRTFFIAFSKRSRWAEMECHLSLLEQRKIDRAKNDQSFTSFKYKNPYKILKTLKAKFQAGQLFRLLLAHRFAAPQKYYYLHNIYSIIPMYFVELRP
jgi:hypothetical protein